MDIYTFARFLIMFFGLRVCVVRLVSCELEAPCTVRARIDSGWVCGKRRATDDGGHYNSFRGIPYAEQPVGRLRFKELRPVTPWSHYLDATEERAVCPQHDEVFGRLIKPVQGMSEACIYANVHVPIKTNAKGSVDFTSRSLGYKEHVYESKRDDKGLPILVYIHGGGFRSGSGDADLIGPEYLVRRGVIVITFNYRINVFGFLYLNTPEVPGNQGLRDQVTLLRWVQRNARAFGGDPDNVTLMGQSAGASAVHLLSLSKATKGLFKRVILSSGTANRSFFTASPLFSKAVAALFLAQLGINSTNPTEIHEQLVATPLNEILLANSEIQYITGIISFSPVVESSFPGITRVVDDNPTELVKRGRGNQYPLMVGFNTRECAVFRPIAEYLDLKSRVEANPLLLLSPDTTFSTPPAVSIQLARRAIRKYFKRRFTYDEYEKECSDTFFVYPSFQLANLRASMKGASVYLYQFSYQSQVNFVQKAAWLQFNGTGHIEDFVRIFKPNAFSQDIGVKQLPEGDGQIVDWMTKFVVNFMRCSKPTCSSSDSQSPWPAVRYEEYNYQDIRIPGEYLHTGPTPRQWGFIQFNENIDAESRRAQSEEGVLTEGSPMAESFMANFSSQFIFKRPNYPFAIVYRQDDDKTSLRFKSLQSKIL